MNRAWHGRSECVVSGTWVLDGTKRSNPISGCQKRICHGFHVHLAHSLEGSDQWSCDGRFHGSLYDSASHWLKNLFGKAGVALEGQRSDRGDHARGASDGSDGVHSMQDLVHVQRCASLGVALVGDVDAKVAHEDNGHVDVELRDTTFPVRMRVVSHWA